MDKVHMKQKKIGVLMGGRSSEREISLQSGNAVMEALRRKGYHVSAIDPASGLIERLTDEKIEVAYIALHGKWGEDGTVQGLLEIMGIPYTGPGVLGSSTAMDKIAMKLILSGIGLPTPDYAVATRGDAVDFPLPFVVKPANEGSTIGISVVREDSQKNDALETAFRYDKKVLVEKFVKGPEITVAVVNGQALPTIEVRPASGFYDFKAKYTKGMTEYIVPAPVSETAEKRSVDTALKVCGVFDLAGSVRIDMLIENEVPMVIDINTSPGMTENSLVPKAWINLGGTFDGLVEEILLGAALKI
ncbi:MAG: D-alanine--D-alanine ligase [Syntrophobacterales bacterium]|jgi:D-alanine-D-alanine ligase|nr:D-alanine--D-alanine ligase [Syntrophobacterales bacterium]